MAEVKVPPRVPSPGSSSNKATSSWGGVPISDSYSELVESLNRKLPDGEGKSDEATPDQSSRKEKSRANQPSVIVDVDIAEYTKPVARTNINMASSAVDVDLFDTSIVQHSENSESVSTLAESLNLSQSVQLNGIDVELAEAWQEIFDENPEDVSDSPDVEELNEEQDLNEKDLNAKATAEMKVTALAKTSRAEMRRAFKNKAEAVHREAARVKAARLEAKRDAVTRAEKMRAKAVRVEAGRVEAVRVEAVRVESKRAEAVRVEVKRAEAMRVEAARAEATRVKVKREEAARLEAARAEVARAEAKRAEAKRAEAKRAEAKRAEAKRAEAKRAEAKRAEAKRLESERANAESEKKLVIEQAKLATTAEIERLNTSNVVSKIDSVQNFNKQQNSPRSGEMPNHPALHSSSALTPSLAEEVDVVWLDDTSKITAVDIVLPPNTGQSLSDDDGWTDGTFALDETSSAALVLDNDDYLNHSMEFMAAIREEDFDDSSGFTVPAASYSTSEDKRGWVARTISAIEKVLNNLVKKPARWMLSRRPRK